MNDELQYRDWEPNQNQFNLVLGKGWELTPNLCFINLFTINMTIHVTQFME